MNEKTAIYSLLLLLFGIITGAFLNEAMTKLKCDMAQPMRSPPSLLYLFGDQYECRPSFYPEDL